MALVLFRSYVLLIVLCIFITLIDKSHGEINSEDDAKKNSDGSASLPDLVLIYSIKIFRRCKLIFDSENRIIFSNNFKVYTSDVFIDSLPAYWIKETQDGPIVNFPEGYFVIVPGGFEINLPAGETIPPDGFFGKSNEECKLHVKKGWTISPTTELKKMMRELSPTTELKNESPIGWIDIILKDIKFKDIKLDDIKFEDICIDDKNDNFNEICIDDIKFEDICIDDNNHNFKNISIDDKNHNFNDGDVKHGLEIFIEVAIPKCKIILPKNNTVVFHKGCRINFPKNRFGTPAPNWIERVEGGVIFNNLPPGSSVSIPDGYKVTAQKQCYGVPQKDWIKHIDGETIIELPVGWIVEPTKALRTKLIDDLEIPIINEFLNQYPQFSITHILEDKEIHILEDKETILINNFRKQHSVISNPESIKILETILINNFRKQHSVFSIPTLKKNSQKLQPVFYFCPPTDDWESQPTENSISQPNDDSINV